MAAKTYDIVVLPGDGIGPDVVREGRRVLDDFDVVAACGTDFTQVAIKTFENVNVQDGQLEIRFVTEDGRSPSVKLANAIEVIRQGE